MSIESRARLGIGRVFQNFGIFKNLTLEENLAMAFVHQIPWYQKMLPLSFLNGDFHDRIDEVLGMLHLTDKKKTKAGELS